MEWRGAVAVALLLAPVALALDKYIEDTDRFPGWRGELPGDTTAGDTVGFGELGKEVWRGRVEQVSWRPRAFVYHNFLSDEECEHLKAMARKRLTKSTVVDNKTGKSMDSAVRTSSGTFLARGEDDIVRRIEKRISLITMIPEGSIALATGSTELQTSTTDFRHDKSPSTMQTANFAAPFTSCSRACSVLPIAIPVANSISTVSLSTMLPITENGEAIQILKYVDGQKYEPHTDYFHDKYNSRTENGGQRVATVLMYLSTPEEGGETVFPYAEKKVEGEGWSDCARRGLAVKAVKGNALLFYSLKPNGEEDQASTHGSCPTLAGEKWSATRWIHVGAFQSGGAKGCVDDNDKCEEWAVMGECQNNPAFMKANCRKSCDVC